MNGDNFTTCVIGNSCGVTGKIITIMPYSKPVYNGTLKKAKNCFFKNNYHLMQVKSIAECSKGSILQYFRPSLSYHQSLKTFVLSILSIRFTHVLLFYML